MLFKRTVLFVSIFALAGAVAHAQVRYRMRAPGRGKSMPAHEVIAQEQQRAAEAVRFTIKPEAPSANRKDLDARFYVPWTVKRNLYYTDFLNNKQLYNKFLSPHDTDLTDIIYPDYRAFYTKLNERILAEGASDADWQSRIQPALNYNYDSLQGNLESMVFDDDGTMTAISVDSPAASVVILNPVIYPVDDHTWYYNITALFSKYDSWLIIKARDIVDHEQIHFDIYELYARKMRKATVDNLRRNFAIDNLVNAQAELNLEFEQIFQQMYDRHLEFDRETMTFTSNNAPLNWTNIKWKNMLRREMGLLKDYEVAEGHIFLR